jgi:hypothetical protein
MTVGKEEEMKRFFVFLIYLVGCTSVPVTYERAYSPEGKLSGDVGISAQSTGWFFSVPDAGGFGVILNGRLDTRVGYNFAKYLDVGIRTGAAKGYSTGTGVGGSGWKGGYYLFDVYPYFKVWMPYENHTIAVELAAGGAFNLFPTGNPSVHPRTFNGYVDILIGSGHPEWNTFVLRIGGTPFDGLGVGDVIRMGRTSLSFMFAGFPFLMAGFLHLHVGIGVSL